MHEFPCPKRIYPIKYSYRKRLNRLLGGILLGGQKASSLYNPRLERKHRSQPHSIIAARFNCNAPHYTLQHRTAPHHDSTSTIHGGQQAGTHKKKHHPHTPHLLTPPRKTIRKPTQAPLQDEHVALVSVSAYLSSTTKSNLALSRPLTPSLSLALSPCLSR